MKNSIELKGVLLDDVVGTFSKLGRNACGCEHPVGCLNSVTNDDKTGVTDGHAQGSNVYVDKNGRKHFIVSYDNRDSSMNGRLLVFSEPLHGKVKAMNIEIISEHEVAGKTFKYNHPGSFQIIDDYLFLPIEYYMGSNGENRIAGCEIQVFDLRPLGNSTDRKPVMIARWSILPKGEYQPHRAGMLGVTKNWIGIHDNNVFYLYQNNGLVEPEVGNIKQLQLKSFGFQELLQAEGIALVEENGTDNLYLMLLSCDKENGKWIDRIHLYIITDINVEEATFNATEVDGCNIHVYTDPGNGETGDHSIHFKFGGGIYLFKDEKHESITCFATGQKIQQGKRFNFNTFSTENRIEVSCKSGTLSGEGARASQNFSVKGFSSDKIKFSLYVDGEKCTKNVVVNVSKDNDGGAQDNNVYTEVGKSKTGKWEDTEKDYTGQSPLYFSSPCVPESYNKKDIPLRFVIEGV